MKFLAALLAAAVIFIGPHIVSSHHNIILPVIPNTPAIYSILDYGSLAYCINPRAANYPGFRAQVAQTMTATREFAAVSSYEVPWGTPWGVGPSSGQTGCAVQHVMPDNPNFCAGCAANVRYADWPVLIQYKWTTGYSDWKSTVGHEFGHVLGLHEQYVDLGSINCTNRTDTVMDCGGPPFEYILTFLDISRLKTWLYPQPVFQSGVAFHQGQPFIWFAADLFRADHAAVMYRDPNGAYYWSGITAFPGNDGYMRAFYFCSPGRQVWVNQQDSKWPESYNNPNTRADTFITSC